MNPLKLIEKYEIKLQLAIENKINIPKYDCMDIVQDVKIRIYKEIIDDLKGKEKKKNEKT